MAPATRVVGQFGILVLSHGTSWIFGWIRVSAGLVFG
jgi:hypothetical protein